MPLVYASPDAVNYEFGDRRIDYMREYERIAQCRNILELEEKNIISHYRCIMKARFLMDYPTAMFIEPNTQIVLNDVLLSPGRSFASTPLPSSTS